ncbi:MAG: Fur family transcriptional regulator [Acetobacteraceae bacterium]
MKTAEDACLRNGARLMETRRQVLALVMATTEPVGAYTLLERLKAEKPNATPVTIYRALGFLQEQGLVHKVERLNAFIGCIGQGEHHHHRHAAQFLICRNCGIVTEIEDTGIAASVDKVAASTGFRPARVTVEVEGTCAACAGGRGG